MSIDEGLSVHYTAVTRGTPVYTADEVEIAKVEAVVDNYREHIFDGLIFRDSGGTVRFADAPEVARTAERGVTLAIDAEAAARLGPPEKKSGPSAGSGSGGGVLGRLFGRKR
jgi:hypothetical protein